MAKPYKVLSENAERSHSMKPKMRVDVHYDTYGGPVADDEYAVKERKRIKAELKAYDAQLAKGFDSKELEAKARKSLESARLRCKARLMEMGGSEEED